MGGEQDEWTIVSTIQERSNNTGCKRDSIWIKRRVNIKLAFIPVSFRECLYTQWICSIDVLWVIQSLSCTKHSRTIYQSTLRHVIRKRNYLADVSLCQTRRWEGESFCLNFRARIAFDQDLQKTCSFELQCYSLCLSERMQNEKL